MANDGSVQKTVWPLPKFYFQVDLGDGQVVPFQEVSGLDIESQVIEYRAGNKKDFSTVKMPGIQKSGNIILKKGVFAKDNHFFDWYNAIKMNVIKRKTVSIRLLDEAGNVTMEWKLKNAWPTKMTGTDLKSDGNEVAIESLELAHEGLSISGSK